MMVNGVRIRAIVDTGAAYTILLGGRRARRRGRPCRAARGNRDRHRRLYPLGVARVASVEIGGQSLGRMAMRIGQRGMPYTLLGQPEIARLGRVTIEDGVMTITPRALTTQLAMR
ncbi:hypothetical protein QP185_04565 [Sphingomonas aerolata]|uniref:hypothetical protein n=1 Tax=Sphingomonas aerolata TaxID=185951 RepID=UPI002FE3D270